MIRTRSIHLVQVASGSVVDTPPGHSSTFGARGNSAVIRNDQVCLVPSLLHEHLRFDQGRSNDHRNPSAKQRCRKQLKCGIERGSTVDSERPDPRRVEVLVPAHSSVSMIREKVVFQSITISKCLSGKRRIQCVAARKNFKTHPSITSHPLTLHVQTR